MSSSRQELTQSEVRVDVAVVGTVATEEPSSRSVARAQRVKDRLEQRRHRMLPQPAVLLRPSLFCLVPNRPLRLQSLLSLPPLRHLRPPVRPQRPTQLQAISRAVVLAEAVDEVADVAVKVGVVAAEDKATSSLSSTTSLLSSSNSSSSIAM